MRYAWLPWILAAGCFTPPIGIRDAERALLKAEAAGAGEYFPVEHAATRELLRKAKVELTQQDRESITRRNYRVANRLLLEVEGQAWRLTERTEIRKEQVRSSAVFEMQMLMATEYLISRLDPATDLRRLDAAVQSAQRAYDRGRYLEALDSIREGQALADEILERRQERARPGA